jgi:hypothetical protein
MTEHNPGAPGTEEELLELIHSIDEPAPAHLHERIQAMVADRTGSSTSVRRFGLGLSAGWRLGWAGTAIAAIVAAVVLAFTGGAGTGPSLSEATALTLRAPSMSAPAENASDRGHLDVAVDGISFPNWTGHGGWRASGQRVDNLYGRTIRTVFYTNPEGLQLGYAIVAGRPAPGIGAGAAHWRDGTRYRLTSQHGAPVVTWLRNGHLCIVSGRGVAPKILLALASWDDHDRLS